MRRALAAFVAAVATCFAAPAPAAEDQAEGPAEIEVRTGGDLGDPGRPVTTARGAWVADGESPADARGRSVAADAAGVLRMQLPKGGGTALVFADGFAPVAVRVNLLTPRRVSLKPSRSLLVKAVDDAGRPVPGADAVLETVIPAFGGAPPRHVHTIRVSGRTGTDGTLPLDGLADGPSSLRVSIDDRVPTVIAPISPEETSVVATIRRGSTVRGRIVLRPAERSPGAPGEDAAVFVGLGVHRAPVAKDGTFELRTVESGDHEFSVEGDDIASPPLRVVKIDGDRDGLDAEVWRAATLRFALEIPADAPEAAARMARVTLRWPDGGSSVVDVKRAEAWPELRLPRLAPMDGVEARLDVPGCVPALVRGISLVPGEETKPIRVPLERGGTVYGRLSAKLGRSAVAGATVTALPEGEGPERAASSVTDGRGDFELRGVRAGRFTAVVRVEGLDKPQTFGPFRLEFGKPAPALDLSVDAAFTLPLELVDVPTDIRAPATVRITSEDGRVVERPARLRGPVPQMEVTGLAAGRVLVEVIHDGQVLAAERDVPVPAGWPVRLVCAKKVECVARLADESGRPVPTGTVTAERVPGDAAVPADGPRGTASRPVRIAVRDPGGVFRTSLVEGRWRFAASDGAGRRGVLECALRADAPPDELVIRMEAGARLSGILSLSRGEGTVEGAEIFAVPVTEPFAGGEAGSLHTAVRATAAANGTFVLEGVPSGVVAVRVRGSGLPWRDLPPRRVEPREVVDLGVIDLAGGVRLALLVRDETGPLAHVAVTVEGAEGTFRSVTTDAYGRASVAAIESGCAYVRLAGTGRAVRIDIPDRVDFHEQAVDLGTGVRLVGRITTAGRDEPFARVAAWRDGATVSAVADATGRYALPALPRGELHVEITAAGSLAPWRTTLRLHADGEHAHDFDLPEGVVRGIVRSERTGDPVAGATVRAWRGSRADPPDAMVRTRGDGTFELQRIDLRAPLVVTATAPGHGESAPSRAGLGSRSGTDLLIDLPAATEVRARILDTEGRAISDAWIVARLADVPLRGWGTDAEPDAKPDPGPHSGARYVDGPRAAASPGGHVRLGGLAPGSWRISAGAPGYGRVELGTIRVFEAGADLGDLTLERQGVIEVIAWRSLSGPISGVEIAILDAYDLDPRPPRRPDDPLRGADPAHVTDAHGRLRIPGLAPGTWRLRALPRSGDGTPPAPTFDPGADPSSPAPREIRITVRPGQIARVVVPVM